MIVKDVWTCSIVYDGGNVQGVFCDKEKAIYTRLNCLDSCYKSGFEVWWKAKNHQF